MSNVVISGYYGSRNAGDEAMLAAMVEVLSDLDPKVNITVISANPQDTRQRHGVKAVGWLDLAGILGALRSTPFSTPDGLMTNKPDSRSIPETLPHVKVISPCFGSSIFAS